MLETSQRFCETLVSHMFFKWDEISQSATLTVKTRLVFLKYIFQFFINKALPLKQRRPEDDQSKVNLKFEWQQFIVFILMAIVEYVKACYTYSGILKTMTPNTP